MAAVAFASLVLRIVAYCRVSTKEQHLHGFSLPAQEERIRAWCAERGWPVVEVICDHQSGKTLARKGLTRLRELAAAGACDAVVCIQLDRLARVNYLRRMVEAELEAAGVEAHYVDQQFERTPAGRLQKGVMGELAEFESEQIRTRTMGGRAKKARDRAAMPCWGEPYGYRQVTVAMAAVMPEYRDRSGELEILPDKEGFVREMFERVAAGASLRSLAKWANASGHSPSRGGRWNPSSLRLLLRNPAYKGERTYGSKAWRQTAEATSTGETLRVVEDRSRPPEKVPLTCPAIVTVELWNAVQARLDENQSVLGGRPSDQWPLSPVTRCAVCKGQRGKPVSCSGKIRRKKRCYECASGRRDGLTYCGATFDGDALEEMARTAIRRLLAPGALAKLAREAAEKAMDDTEGAAAQERALRAQVAALNAELEELLDDRLQGVFPRAMLERKAAALNETLARVEGELRVAVARKERVLSPKAAALQAEALSRRLAEGLDRRLADPKEFKALAQALLEIRLAPGQEPLIALDPRVLTG